jgi:hypothetical protein
MGATYWVRVEGRYIFNSIVLTCPTCGADRGLTFTTSVSGYNVTGSCPNSHVWDEVRVPAVAVRQAAIDSERKG